MNRVLKIGTRDSELALYQATLVKNELAKYHVPAELVLIKSEGDIDLVTPLYEMGVEGIFTKTLDAALLSKRIDIAVHSMKDVPVQLAAGIMQAAVLPRDCYKDIFVYKGEWQMINDELENGKRESLIANAEALATGELLIKNQNPGERNYKPQTTNHKLFIIATSSIRRRAQWLHRYPHHTIENLRGNVNTRLRKLKESNWKGAIFAAAGLERIGLRPANSIDLDWMLPAPAQGAIIIVCREEDREIKKVCAPLNHTETALCTKVERDFLKALMGGCSMPISALAEIKNDMLYFKGNILSPDGKRKREIEKAIELKYSHRIETLGCDAANEILKKGAKEMVEEISNAGK